MSTEALEDIRARKQALLEEVSQATGNPQKQDEIQGKLRELRKEKAGVVKADAEVAE